MKKYAVHITLAVVIIAIAVVIGCRYFNKQDSPVISNSVETSEPEITEEVTEQTYTETIITEDTGTTEEEISIDWDSIDPKVHAKYIKDANIVNLDDTICEYMLNNCPAFKGSTIEQVEDSITVYLIAYYNDKFGDNEWLQFASTGDESVLNLEASEEHEMTAEEIADAEAQMKEKMYKKLAIKLGITVEEAKAMLDKNLNDNDADNTSHSNGTNGGGGSSPVATPDTNQGNNVAEEDFVTSEVNTPSSPGSQDSIIDFGAAADRFAETTGDGGPLTGNVTLDP